MGKTVGNYTHPMDLKLMASLCNLLLQGEEVPFEQEPISMLVT